MIRKTSVFCLLLAALGVSPCQAQLFAIDLSGGVSDAAKVRRARLGLKRTVFHPVLPTLTLSGEVDAPARVTIPWEPEDVQKGLSDPARGGGTLGALLGGALGIAVGPSLFEGRDMGCDKVQCYGRLNSSEAALAGAVVMSGIGALGGTAIGSLGDSGFLKKMPLKDIDLDISPRGKPGVKISAGLTF